MRYAILFFYFISLYFFTGQIDAYSAEIDYFAKAEKVEKQGHYFEAISWYDQAIKRDPRSYTAMTNQSKLYYKVGKRQKAVDVMRQSLKLNPFYVESNFNMGIMLVTMGHYKKGITYLETTKKLRPKLFEIYPHMAEAYGKTGDIRKAKVAYNTMIEMRPKTPWIHREYARYLDRIGHFKFAKEQYKDAVKLIPKDFEYRYEYASFLKRKMNADQEALDQFKKALDYNKDHKLARYELARIYEGWKQFELAKEHYQYLLTKYPKFIDPYIRMGVVARNEDRFSDSLAFYADALKLDHKNIKALEERALIYVKMKKYDKAAKEYFLLTSFYPKYAKPYIFRGWLFEMIGRTDKAEKEYTMAIHLDQKNIEARIYLGMMYNTSERFDQSKKIFQDILKIDKENDQARFQLAEIFYKQNEYELANYHYARIPVQSVLYKKSRVAREQVEKFVERDKVNFKRLPASKE